MKLYTESVVDKSFNINELEVRKNVLFIDQKSYDHVRCYFQQKLNISKIVNIAFKISNAAKTFRKFQTNSNHI